MELISRRMPKELLTIWLCLMTALLPLAWTRSLSVSLNLTLSRSELPADNETVPPALDQDILRTCMRQTELSMSHLKLFRLSLLSNDDSADNNEVGADDNGNNFDSDYAINSQLDLKSSEPLQCFVRCLYEHMGLIKYNTLLEQTISGHLQSIIQSEQPDIKECQDLQSKDRCEAAYKLHLCSVRLSTLHAEKRIRAMLERSDIAATMLDNEMANKEQNSDTDPDIADVIMEAVQQ